MSSEDEEEASLEHTMRSRLRQIIGRLTLYVTEAESHCQTVSGSDKDAVQKAQICAIKLETIIKRFTTELNEYFRTVNNPSAADEIAEMSGIQLSGEEILAELNFRLTSAQENQTRGVGNQNANKQGRIFSAKLPTLTLPEFSGDVLAWCEFWDIYKSNIHDRLIPDVDKLLYLKSTLKGEPRRIIDGLETTNKNYEIAVQILTSRYGKHSQIIDAHYSALNKVKAAGTPIGECRVTLNEIERHLRVLQSLGENTNHNHLRHLIMEKFPGDIVYEIKMKMKEDTIEEIRKHLELIISAREEANKTRQETIPTEGGSHTVETLHTTHLNREQIRNRPLRKYNNSKRDMNIKKEKNRPGYTKEWSSPSTSRHQHDSSRKRKHVQTRDNNKDRNGGRYGHNDKNKERRGTFRHEDKKRRKLACVFCEKDHYPDQCEEYNTIQARRAKLKNRCFSCLLDNHFIRSCKNKRECVYCHKTGLHHRALCPEKIKNRETTLTTVNGDGFTILQTAIVTVKNEKYHGIPIRCRVLLDSGSQRSYITREVSKRLNLPVEEEDKLSIFGFASEIPQTYDSSRVKLEMTTRTNKTITLHANEIPTITKGVQLPEINPGKWKNKPLADDGSLGERIDILIGNDFYFNFMSTEKLQLSENLFLINSDFGWIFSGRLHDTQDNYNTLSIVTYCQGHDPSCAYFTEPDLPLKNMDISFLWALESIGITDNPKTTREEEAFKHLNETIQYVNGRYMVKWPWVQYPPELPTNFGLAFGRLKGLLQRLNENAIKEYQEILEEQLKGGVIEIINPEKDVYTQRTPPIHYLPHHMVKQEGKKGRIVYDASGKIKNSKSLNECMYRGPSMISDLLALLIQFRTHKVAITADVEKAFLQIGLQSEDRDVTRFIWIKDLQKPLSLENIVHLRFSRMPFGIIASPFLLTATLKYHISQFAPELVHKIVDKCYVDNLVLSVDSEIEALDLYREARKAFQQISMNIRDWQSSSQTFLDNIPDKYKTHDKGETKVLGLIWNPKKDTVRLNIKPQLFEESMRDDQSKRKVLSTLASIFDPCGICSPLTLPTKLLLQELWELKLKWDTVLPGQLQRKWKDIVERLKLIEEVEIPRFVGPKHTEKACKAVYSLHGFSDASKQAYAAVVYLRTEDRDRQKTAFIMSKSKVVPKKDKSNLQIPRLELLGCYLCSKLLTYVKNTLDLPMEKEYLWTDSQIVLSWVHSNKLLPPFIERRVNTIKENKQLEFRYIKSEENPADLATRPDLWHKKKVLWPNGPKFLTQKEKEWPSHSIFEFPSSSSLGQGPSDIINLTGITHRIPEKTFQEENRDMDNVIKKIKDLQTEHFPLESEGKKTSLAINLDLYKDIDGLLRCNGRMKNTDWSFDKRHPVLIPRNCEFTNDLITKTHRENYHMGANHTLSKVRESYWIPKGKSYVQKILKKCPECIKHSGGPFKLPPAPALPHERVNYSAPFTYTGLDYMGPVLINNGDGNRKRWICLFTCLVVRAVHLEVVQDLTAEEGLLALRKMISTRGTPSLLTSDNAQHFKLIAEITSNQYCIEKKIRWRFITPLSPWAGGYYERLIGIVKNCMKKTLEKRMLKDSQLSTSIKEIEAVINSRPLTSVDSEPDYILKPSDFLTMGKVITVEESENNTDLASASTTKTELIKGWKRALIILKEFKDMFTNRYLLSLRERYKHLPKEPRITSKLTPSPGQVVQIKGDSKNRSGWKVGKIMSLVPSADGLCRAARVRVGKSEYTRSIAHLYPLEIEDDCSEPITDTASKYEENYPIETTTEDMTATEGREAYPQILDPTYNTPQLEDTVPAETVEMYDLNTQHEDDFPSAQLEAKSLPDETDINDTDILIQRPKRATAIKALEKIKNWTRDLTALLLRSSSSALGSVATSANP